MKVTFHRSPGYGWSLMLHINGKHRARWNSTRATSMMWPGLSRGADEDCNRAVTLTLWPIGHLDIWWEPSWRAERSGICDKCARELEEMAA
jgi:hypothetical protein